MISQPEPDREPPSFAEARDALAPDATGKNNLWAALKNTQATGGHIPGRTAPDVSMAGGSEAVETLRDLLGRQTGWPVPPPAITPHPAPPAGHLAGIGDITDPFGHDTAPAIALAELYDDMLGAGIPLASVERILGAALAAMGKDEKP